jgi:transcription termination factor Rho
VNIAELKRKSMPELHDMADTLAVAEHDALGRHDLLFKIEQKLLDAEHTLMGEGVLEVLPEGYGFLRSQDWNYLYSPDDIYVSPSSDSICAPATPSPGRFARRRNGSAISRS